MAMAKKRATPAAQRYRLFLGELKEHIGSSRLHAARAVNSALIRLYWHLGEAIVREQETQGWGQSVVERLSRDLLRTFPDMRGLSSQNLWRMRQFYLDHTDPAFLRAFAQRLKAPGPATSRSKKGPRSPVRKELSQAVRELLEAIPWGHHANVLARVKDPAARAHYLRATAAFGWSRDVLLFHLKNLHYERSRGTGKSHNFRNALPAHLTDLAEQTLKSSYNIEFIGARQVLHERDLEDRLITRVQQFILELGYGFCFIGRQYKVVVSDSEYYIDLLFYHRLLKCLVAIELKVGAFKPEHSGKMDFYLNVLNDKERLPGDNPSIGIILCGKKSDVVVEYSLRGRSNPIGVAELRHRTALPPELRGKLPTAQALQAVVQETLAESGTEDSKPPRKTSRKNSHKP